VLSTAFTPASPGVVATSKVQTGTAPALRGSADTSGANSSSAAQLVGLLGAAGAVAAVAKAPRTIRRAEPVSAAAAAVAVAKAAAAGKAATATTSAVAGAAGTGSLTKGKGVAGQGGGAPNFDPAAQIGATDPFGFFDPAGFSKKGDEAGFRNLRAAEIKHARAAMMAALGAVVQHYVKFPGFESVPSGLSAALTAPGSYGFVALFAVAGILELSAWTESDDKEPGNFGDPAGLGQYTTDMRNRELNNGRFAMFAAMGIIAGEIVTGKDAIEQFGA
jgi:hypothetical protein